MDFERLAYEASAEVERTGNISSIVPFCTGMLDLIKRNPALRSEFCEAIKRLWYSKKVEEGLIELCCHALQWHELKRDFAEALVEAEKNGPWNDRQYLGRVVEAFDSDWEDAKDFYADYFNN
ncbi:hypothetical protein [Nitrogeniibacter aestuarii]|uniref:hypothetical protein n=1 Tax=Nitrogeniibacter aestuarii TaxID=2815343 RepID=UPI001E4CB209|nr:hypothetical protein [Nitrogeniibacter aestuarii]